MNSTNRNSLWASTFVDELARAGLKAACIAPGSRSTPLTVAFAEHPDITVYSLLDERSAAFFALGLALASENAVALICTSGTATANFHPAIIEADSAQVPLLVLTTDRPPELRHSGANQTIDQLKMFGDHLRWFVEVALPEANPSALVLRSLRTLADRALAVAAGLPPGPVHLNFPFRKPLEPTSVPGDVSSPLPEPDTNRKPFSRISRGRLVPSETQVDTLVDAIRQSPRGLIVCGPRCPGGNFPEAVVRLARLSGYPILADALSGVRFGPQTEAAGVTVLGGYETFLQPEVTAGWQPPNLILRFGAMPVSKMLNRYIGAHPGCRHVQLSGIGVWQDDTHTTGDFIWADPAATCAAIGGKLETMLDRDEAWLAQFRQAEQLVWQTVQHIQDQTFFEGATLLDVVGSLPQTALLFSANSLPVRHLDQFVRPNSLNLRVVANRGASGIDGTIASAVGMAAASEAPLVLVIGDLAFYHDMNSLLALRRCGVNITIVLINNNGGGIFHRLPIANFDPPFTEMFVTPHGLNFEPIAAIFGAEFIRPGDRDSFRQLFRESVATNSTRILEVRTDSAHHERVRRNMIETVITQITKNDQQ